MYQVSSEEKDLYHLQSKKRLESLSSLLDKEDKKKKKENQKAFSSYWTSSRYINMFSIMHILIMQYDWCLYVDPW